MLVRLYLLSYVFGLRLVCSCFVDFYLWIYIDGFMLVEYCFWFNFCEFMFVDLSWSINVSGFML